MHVLGILISSLHVIIVAAVKLLPKLRLFSQAWVVGNFIGAFIRDLRHYCDLRFDLYP